MQHPKIPLAQTVIQLCKGKHIQHIVISPGSRNAPLTMGFSADNYFTCYSIVDERCAAFFALGIAQQTQQPVALVCTSGSALLNYYPAIAEAFYSDIPLVVISADRPEHLIGVGDGQTIDQQDVFKNHILYSANLKEDVAHTSKPKADDESAILKNLEYKLERLLGFQKELQKFNEIEINTAINISIQKKGPVHINVPFDEPLYEMVEDLSISPEIISPKTKNENISSSELNMMIEDWELAPKKMILVGVNPKDSIDQNWLEELANDDSVIVFTETTSNIHHDEFFPSIDKIIAPLQDDDFKQLQPDILLTFGGLIVSKKIKAFLRKYQPKQHWHIDVKRAHNTFFSLDKHIKMSPNAFFSEFIPKLTYNRKSNYKPFWQHVKTHRDEQHEEYLNSIPFSDFVVYNQLLKGIPNYTVLQIGNSSAIRYAQLFNINKTLEVHCNRGTSGIDGSTSTAIGFASATDKQVTLLTGDVSFFYDSNALWNNYIPNNFRIILINNNGGGIFRILPGQKNTENFDTFFETKHNLTAKHLCSMFNFEYAKATNKNELDEGLNNFYKASDKPKLLEVFTPRTENDIVLLEYFKFIK